EAARVLSQYRFNYTIIYALWDEEEKGLIGSYNYARKARENNENIVGVLNMDMIGYDGNGDYLFEVHKDYGTMNDGLRNKLTGVLENNSFDLVQSIQVPGTDRSDHNSFWFQNYPAIFITEGFFNNDFNPT
ncbi:MAG: M28 family peptidase, partial [Candidatus Kapaibacterium sp.]